MQFEIREILGPYYIQLNSAKDSFGNKNARGDSIILNLNV